MCVDERKISKQNTYRMGEVVAKERAKEKIYNEKKKIYNNNSIAEKGARILARHRKYRALIIHALPMPLLCQIFLSQPSENAPVREV